MKMPRSSILLLCAALCLSAACSRPPSDEWQAPYSLDDFEIEGPVNDALAASLDGWGLHSQGFDSSTVAAFHISEAIGRPESREEAIGRLFEHWRRDTLDISWIDVAFFNLSFVRSRPEFEAMKSYPALSDSNSAIGLYFQGRLSGQRSIRIRNSIRAAKFADELEPVHHIKLIVKVADALSRGTNPDSAVTLLLPELPIAAKIGGAPLEARVWEYLGYCLVRAERVPEAMHAHTRSAQLYARAGVIRKAHGGVEEVGRALTLKGESRRAYEIFRWLDREAGRLDFPFLRIRSQLQLGILLSDANENRLALHYQNAAVRTGLAVQDSLVLPRLYLNLADQYVREGAMDSAYIALQEAKTWMKHFPAPRAVWAVNIDESDYWLLQGNYAKADSLRRLAESLAPGVEDQHEAAQRLLRIAAHGREMGRVEISFDALLRVKALMDSVSVGSPSLDAEFRYNMGMAELRLETGELSEARRHIAASRVRLEQRPSSERASLYWRNTGLLAELGEDFPAARAAYDSALTNALASGRPLTINRARLNLGNWLLETGEIPAARRQITAIQAPLGQEISFRTMQRKRLMLGRIAMAEGDFTEARDLFESTIADAGANLSEDLRIEMLIGLGGCFDKLGDPRQSLKTLEQAAALLSARQSELRRVEGRNIRFIYTERIRLLTENQELLRGSDRALATLALRQEMNDRLWGATPGPPPRPGRGPVLAVLLAESASYLWVIHDHRVTLRVLPGREEIENVVKTLAFSVDKPERLLAEKSAARLTTWLLEPLRDIWRPREALGILPDGALHGLPWGVLPWKGNSVLDHAPVVELANLGGEVAVPSMVVEAGKLLAIGYNGDGHSGNKRLAHAEEEAREVAALWPWEADLFVGKSALDPWRDMIKANEYRAIHLAVHAEVRRGLLVHSVLTLGTADPNALPLTPRRIESLNLGCDFVFLSCCQASRGAYSGTGAILDLAQAFTRGGAEAVITSSRRIDDRAAKRIAVRFYHHLRDGADPAEALRRAMLDLRDPQDSKWQASYYWAHYHILFGNS